MWEHVHCAGPAGPGGVLYGAATFGCGRGKGCVFSLTPHGSGYTERVLYSFTGAGYTEKVLHTFTGGTDGSQPIGTPVLDAHGDVFGVTQFGGTGRIGVVYELKASASGYSEQVLHNFPDRGGVAQAGLTIASNGTLYGTNYGAGSGYTFHEVHRFTGPPDGGEPEFAGLIPGPGGEYIGATRSGGTARNCSDGGPGGARGCGTVYKLSV